MQHEQLIRSLRCEVTIMLHRRIKDCMLESMQSTAVI